MKNGFDFCVHCGRGLTSARSREQGMGNKCAAWSKIYAPQLLRIIEQARQPDFPGLIEEKTGRP